MVKEFVNQSFEQELGLSETASDYLRQEADRLKVKLQSAEQAVENFREEHNAVSLEDKQNIIVEKLKESEPEGDRSQERASEAGGRRGDHQAGQSEDSG